MERILKYWKGSLILIILLSIFTNCEDKIEKEYTINAPVYLSYEELRQSVHSEVPRTLEKPGKIYFKDQLIFINEIFKGIHVIDNSDPSHPENIAFINIPGNVDMAVKGNILYADSFTDLVAIELGDLSNLKEPNRVKDIFPYAVPPIKNRFQPGAVDRNKGVVIDWEVKRIKEEIEIPKGDIIYYELDMALNSGQIVTSSDGSGTGGSMARFIINQNALYVLESNTNNGWSWGGSNALSLFDISNPLQPIQNGLFEVGWGLETLFINDDKLFIGARDGMHIFDLSNPFAPQHLSTYSHFLSCDPVVVANQTAYITLRDGNICGRNTSQLDVVDLSDPTQPQLIKSYAMTEPYGLGIDDGILFICDGSDGLKIYDATDPYQIGSQQLAHFKEIQPFDIIPINGLIMVIGPKGLQQYDYSNIENIQLLSTIPIESEE